MLPLKPAATLWKASSNRLYNYVGHERAQLDSAEYKRAVPS